jgi:hypothetical protein
MSDFPPFCPAKRFDCKSRPSAAYEAFLLASIGFLRYVSKSRGCEGVSIDGAALVWIVVKSRIMRMGRE